MSLNSFLRPGDFNANTNTVTAGTNQVYQDGNIASYAGTGYTKYKECKILRTGTIRVSFSMYISNGYIGYGKIYKNNIPIGTERTVTSTTPVTFTEDISVTANDLIEIYIKSNNASVANNINSFSLSAAQPDFATKIM